HPVECSTFSEAVSVAPMCARDVIGRIERLTDANGNRFFAYIKVGEAGHQGAGIEVIDLLFEEPDHGHPPVHVKPQLGLDFRLSLRPIDSGCHFETPASFSRTLKMIAKSCSASPMPRAAVRNSFTTEVVGRGTSTWRPTSRASCRSFCIILTLNHASSGIFRTKGPRYCSIGEATTLCRSTSTAVSRGMPLFSASNTPSVKARICVGRERLIAIFITSARPFSPTCVAFGPSSSNSGLMRSKVSA